MRMYQFALLKVGQSKLVFGWFFFMGVCVELFKGSFSIPANHKFTCSVGWTPWLVCGQYFNSNPIAQIFFFSLRTSCFLMSLILVEACIANLCLCCAYAPSVLRGLSAIFKLETKKGKLCRYTTTIRGWSPPGHVAKGKRFRNSGISCSETFRENPENN